MRVVCASTVGRPDRACAPAGLVARHLLARRWPRRAGRRVRQGVTGYLQSRAKMLRSGFMVLAATALAGCASGGTSESYQRTTTVVSVLTGPTSGDVSMDSYGGAAPVARALAAGPDTVFAALEEAYKALGVPVAMRDPARWSLGNRNLEISRRLGGTSLSEYFNCGASAMGA